MQLKSASFRKIWDISWPIMLSLVAQNVVNVTDTAFLGHVGAVELGASAIGGIFYITLFMVAYGFATGVQILIARRNGEKQFAEIGDIFENSFYFLGITSLLITGLVIWLGPQMLRPFIQSENVFKASITYLDYRILGMFFASGVLLFRSFYTGVAFTRYISISAAIMAGVNVVLDYGMIFGKLGFPEMGIAGAGLASAISEVCALAFLFFITAGNRHVKKFRLFRFVKPDFGIIRSIFDVSIYVMIQFVLSHSVWFVFFLLIEKMGETSLAVSNIVRSLYMLLMIPSWALSSATSTLVSTAIGEKLQEKVIPVVKEVMLLSLVSMFLIVALAAAMPHFLISIYTGDTALQQASLPSFYIILGAAMSFSFTIVLFNAVLGTGNTRIGMLMEIGTLIIYVVVAWLLAVKLRQPIEIVWLCEYVYSILLGTISWIYLKHGRWQGKVI